MATNATLVLLEVGDAQSELVAVDEEGLAGLALVDALEVVVAAERECLAQRAAAVSCSRESVSLRQGWLGRTIRLLLLLLHISMKEHLTFQLCQ